MRWPFSKKRQKSKDINLDAVGDLLRHLPPQMVTAVLAGGDLKGVIPSELVSDFRIGEPVTSPWTEARAITEGLKQSVWVYACIFRRAKSVASVPFGAETLQKDRWVPEPNHPLTELLMRPNPFWSQEDYFERLVMHLDLAGNAIGSKIRGALDSRPKELWLIGPDKVKPIISREGYIQGYEFTKDSRVFKVEKPSEVIHTQYADPANPWWGLSPLQAAARAVDTDIEAQKWNLSSMQNRAMPSGIVSFPWELSDEQHAKSVERMNANHAGQENARKIMVLGSDAKWSMMSFSPVEMDYIRSRLGNRVEIAATYGVPLPLIGVLDDATLANIETSRKIFWLDTIIPLLDDIRSSYNVWLAPEYGEGVRINYDLSKVEALHTMQPDKVNIAFKIWQMGVPFNIINDRMALGFAPVKDGDIGYVSANFMPVGTLPEGTDKAIGVDLEQLKGILEEADLNGASDDAEVIMRRIEVHLLKAQAPQLAS